MFSGHREAGGQQQRVAIVDNHIGGVCSDINQRHSTGAIVRQYRRIGARNRFKHRFFHRQMGLVNRRDQRMVLSYRTRDHLDVRFQPAADRTLGIAVSGAPVDGEIHRQHLQRHAVVFQPDSRRQFHRVGEVARFDFPRPAELINAAVNSALHSGSADADYHRLDRQT